MKKLFPALFLFTILCCSSCTSVSSSHDEHEVEADSLKVFGVVTNLETTPWQFVQSLYEASFDSSNNYRFFPERVQIVDGFTIEGQVTCADGRHAPLTILGDYEEGDGDASCLMFRLEIRITDVPAAVAALTSQYGEPEINVTGSYDWTINQTQSISLSPQGWGDRLPLLILRIYAS